jgi:hypothetical protein
VERFRYLLREREIPTFETIVDKLLTNVKYIKEITAIKLSHISSNLLKDIGDDGILGDLYTKAKHPVGPNKDLKNIKYAKSLCSDFMKKFLKKEDTIKTVILASMDTKLAATIEVKLSPLDVGAETKDLKIKVNEAKYPIKWIPYFDYDSASSGEKSVNIAFSDLMFCDETKGTNAELSDYLKILNKYDGSDDIKKLLNTYDTLRYIKNINPGDYEIKFTFVNPGDFGSIENVSDRVVNGIVTVPHSIKINDIKGNETTWAFHMQRFCGAAKCIYYYKNIDAQEYIMIGLFSKNVAIANKLFAKSGRDAADKEKERDAENYSEKYSRIKKYDAIYEGLITNIITTERCEMYILSSKISQFESKEIGYDTGYITNMESAFLDLQEYVPLVSSLPNNIMKRQTVLKIALVIIEMIINLYNQGLMYVDLKLQNIMIFTDARDKFYIKFIDLGSIIPSNLTLGEFYNTIFIQNSKANVAWTFDNNNLPDLHNINSDVGEGGIFKNFLFDINIAKTIDVDALTKDQKPIFDAFKASFMMNIMYFIMNLITYFITGENYEGNYNYSVGDKDYGLTGEKIGGINVKDIMELNTKEPTQQGALNSKKPNIYEFSLAIDKLYLYDKTTYKTTPDRDLINLFKDTLKFMETNRDAKDIEINNNNIENQFEKFSGELIKIYEMKTTTMDSFVLNTPCLLDKYLKKINTAVIKLEDLYADGIDPLIDLHEVGFERNIKFFKTIFSNAYKTIDKKKKLSDIKNALSDHLNKSNWYKTFVSQYYIIMQKYKIENEFGYNTVDMIQKLGDKWKTGTDPIYNNTISRKYKADIYTFAFVQKVYFNYEENFEIFNDPFENHTDVISFIYGDNYYAYLTDKYGIPMNILTFYNHLTTMLPPPPRPKWWNSFTATAAQVFNDYKEFRNTAPYPLTLNVHAIAGDPIKRIVYFVHITEINNLLNALKGEYDGMTYEQRRDIILDSSQIHINVCGSAAEKKIYYDDNIAPLSINARTINNHFSLLRVPLIDEKNDVIIGGAPKKHLTDPLMRSIDALPLVGGGILSAYLARYNLTMYLIVLIIVLVIIVIYYIDLDSLLDPYINNSYELEEHTPLKSQLPP